MLEGQLGRRNFWMGACGVGALALAGCPASEPGPEPTSEFMVTTLADVTDANDGEISLREAIAAALSQGQGSVGFADGLSGTILLSAPLVLTGADEFGVYGPADEEIRVDGGGATGLFEVDGVKLTLADLVLSGGRAANGGAVAVSAGKLRLQRVRLEDNAASDRGGALWMDGAASELLVEDCEFVGNRATRFGGGIALADSTVAELLNVSFVDHQALNAGDEVWGAAIYASGGSLELINVSVTGSQSQRGAVTMDAYAGALLVRGGFFEDNVAAETGGALFVQGPDDQPDAVLVSISDASFTGNRAVRGGAVFASGGGLSLEVLTSNFEDNHAVGGDAAGGALWATSQVTLDDSDFSANVAESGALDGVPSDGGAISVSGLSNANDFVATNVRFVGNKADAGGAVNLGFVGAATFDGCLFEQNNALLTGGGLSVLSVERGLSMVDSDLLDNVAGEQGGGLYVGADASLVGTLISGNEANYGGGVYQLDGSELVVGAGSEISGNTANASGTLAVGGGICDEGVVTFSGGTVQGNTPDDLCSEP